MESFEKLTPFMLRAGIIEVGRDRLWQVKNRLAFILVTEDLALNSLDKLMASFTCPVYRCLQSSDLGRLFGYQGTKILGFRRSPLSESAMTALKEHRLSREAALLPVTPRVAVLGASGIGRHHCNWWRLEGSMPSAVLGSSQESVARTVTALRESCGFEGKGYSCLDELLDQEQPDIVDVCLPPRLHYAAVRSALTAGCHVLCEKPFVYDDALPHGQLREQAAELCELGRQKRRLLGVCTQYVMAVRECRRLFGEQSGAAVITDFAGRLVSPTRNRPPVPAWTWVDLAPHMLACVQVLSDGLEPDWESLKVRFDGHLADAEFRCPRPGQPDLQCRIHTFHTDAEPKNVRQLELNGSVYDIGGCRDEEGVFQMEITSPFGSVKRPDMMRQLIRSFRRGRVEMTPEMAVQNLDWMLRVIARGQD